MTNTTILTTAAVAASLLGSLAALPVAHAQDGAYPARPVRIVIPYPAGAPMDVVGRRYAEAIGRQMKGSFVVDNKPGANGTIGAAEVARASGDGHTLLLTIADPLISATALLKSLPYDPARDFRFISKLMMSGAVFVVGAGHNAKTLQEFIGEAKKAGGRLGYGSYGPGSNTQLMIEMFAKQAGVKLTEVTYQGAPPALQAVLAGDIALAASSSVIVMPHLKAGKIHALAVTGDKRQSVLPTVPTFRELGFDHYVLTHGVWNGVVGPASLPPALAERLADAGRAALREPEVQKFIEGIGLDILTTSPAEFERQYREELAVVPKVIRDELKIAPQ